MPERLAKLLEKGEAMNGTRALLEEIRKHQPDMPPEARDDMIFGSLVVLYDVSRYRDKQMSSIKTTHVLTWICLSATWVTILALHANVPWLTNVIKALFGV